MSKSIGTAAAHLANQVTTLAMCWKIVRRDATVFGFTDYHEDLTIDGLTYEAQSGMVRNTAAASHSDLSVTNTEVETVFDSDAIDREDLMAGKWDFAEVYVFLTNYLSPSSFKVKLMRGRLGEISVEQQSARTEMTGLTKLLKERHGRTHEVVCPYELGETKCGVDLSAFAQAGTVDTVVSSRQFYAGDITEAYGYFEFGYVTWLTGLNAGLRMEVKQYNVADFTLSLPMPFAIAIGDTFTAYAGCDKLYATCRTKFSNANFGGFPHIPGTDFMLSYPMSGD